jgi:hypothetical protein
MPSHQEINTFWTLKAFEAIPVTSLRQFLYRLG